MIYFTLFTTLFVVIAQANNNCTSSSNCTLWYGEGYRCDMGYCTNYCQNDTQCTSGYLCCHGDGCYGNCVECLDDTGCGIGEFCDKYHSCETSCNGNDTYCEIQYPWRLNSVCDSSGACVQRECYNNTDCDNKNYTNYRCDTSWFNSWGCIEKCNATSCDYWEPICNSNGECESENCINTPNYCDFGTQICNYNTGYCDTMKCESNNDCNATQGWYCDEWGGVCYMDCLYATNSSYCNSVMWFGKYGGRNYECSSSGECLLQECTADIDCQIQYNNSWIICDNVTRIGESSCTFPNCINTPGFCDLYGGPGSACNTTLGSCYTPPCSSDQVCQDYYGHYFGASYPIAFCNTITGECDDNCTLLDSPGCDGLDDFFKQTTGNEIGFQPTCSDSGSCFEPQTCVSDNECSAPYECLVHFGEDGGGYCILPCDVDTDCYGRLMSGVNDTGVECVAMADNPNMCIPLNECSEDEDCKQGDRRGRKCMDNYCKRIPCTADSECISEFDSKATCYNDYCFDNECVKDDDCVAPFNSCFKDWAESGATNGYQCYTACVYNDTVTTDDEYCTGLLHQDDDGEDIMCVKGAPANVNLTYCDIFSVNYTSCILYEYSCDDDEECVRETGVCETILISEPSTTEEPSICPDEGDNCHGRAKECNRDGRVITDTDSDPWCSWCLCGKFPNRNNNNQLDECAYFALQWWSEGKEKWHEEFVDELAELFMEVCFSHVGDKCSFDDVEMIDNPTDCDCTQFKCKDQEGKNPGEVVGGVECYGVVAVISVVLSMVLWM